VKANSDILSYKLLAVTRETKLTLSIALNPKSKLTLECGTDPTTFKYTLHTPTTRRDASYKLNVVLEAGSGG